MSASVQLSNTAAVKALILQATRDSLGDEQVANLDHALKFTTKVWVGMADGKLACAWGVIPPTLLSTRAYLWLYTNEPVVKDYQFVFVRNSQRVLEALLDEYPWITGVCVKGQDASLRWLRWLGAKLLEPNGQFIPFEIRKKKHG